MKTFFTLLLLVSLKIFAQTHPENKSIDDIALMERQGHQGLADAAIATVASTSFDVKYYRCEWEVDPAVRYIKGKVTVYYVVTATTSSLVFDLMNALTVSSVTQRSQTLTKSQSTNALTINLPGTAS